ncbi:PadR family transcriptional regulator, partial [Nostoc sp. NIES-2111]
SRTHSSRKSLARFRVFASLGILFILNARAVSASLFLCNALTIYICRITIRVDTPLMPAEKPDLLQGTLDLLLLKTLAPGPLHGYAIAQRILITSQEVLQVQQGSLYPALHRLERRHLIASEWKESDSGRMAKFYSLTAAGRRQLKAELDQWKRYAGAINLILES